MRKNGPQDLKWPWVWQPVYLSHKVFIQSKARKSLIAKSGVSIELRMDSIFLRNWEKIMDKSQELEIFKIYSVIEYLLQCKRESRSLIEGSFYKLR